MLEDLANRHYPGVKRDAALARLGRTNLRRYALGQPAAYARMTVGKVWEMWRRPPGRWPPVASKVLHLAIVALGLTGVGLLARRRPWSFAVLAVCLLGITAVSAITLASQRRMLPLVPLLAATAAVAAVWAGAGAARAARRAATGGDAPLRATGAPPQRT